MKRKRKKRRIFFYGEICAERENAGRRQAVSVMLARSLSSRLPIGQSFLSASQFFCLFVF